MTRATKYKPPPYSDAWREYRVLARKKCRAVLVFVIGAIPSMLLLGLLFRALLGPEWADPHKDVLILIGGLPWLAYAGYWLSRLGRWRCPRCGRPFFIGRWYANHFARSCLNCGLDKWNEGAGSTRKLTTR